MTLKRRIDRLEPKKGKGGDVPCVIFLCDAETGEARAALLVGGGSLTREAGESAEAFTARVEVGADGAVFLPDNGRDALATGKAPSWASGALVLKALREKHCRE